MKQVDRMLRLSLALVALALAGCSSAPAAAPTPVLSLADRAAAEATAIVDRAQATAIVLRAQATAAAVIQAAAPKVATPVVPPPGTPPTTGLSATRVPAGPTAVSVSALEPATTWPPMSAPVELTGVSFGVDGDFISVQFRAQPQIARQWMQGNVYLVDEATGFKYNEIPVLPLIGPLIAHPREEGQPGYVMLVNPGRSLESGALVTVVLGDFKQEHVPVQ